MIETVPLGEVAHVFNGKTPSKAEKRSVGHPVLKIKDVDDRGVFCGEFDSFVDDSFARRYRHKAVQTNDVLILNAAHNSDYVGSKMLQAPPEVQGSIATGEWLMARSASARLDQGYMWHWFQSPPTRDQIRGKVKGIHLYPRDVAELLIPVPGPDEQRRIAAILDKADAIRRKREQALALADDFLRSVFLEMFGDPLTNANNLPSQPLGKFGRIVTGNTPPRSDPGNFGDAIEWIKSDNVNTNEHFLTRAAEGLSDKGRTLGRIVPNGSILVTCIAGSPSSIGRAAIANRPVAFNQQINAIIPNPDVNVYFLYVQFLIGKQLVLRSSTNSMKGMISKGEFQKIKFLRPGPDEQAKFGRIFEKHLAANNRFLDQKVMANDLFAALSQRAFAGNL
ncbi:type I restriction enzyme S subunit [Tardiphaga robiniae]|uniref:restriction endonuclease subunit S n=1 Tax=Tardiphaga robiniae TaxID=943830 RepID=UPI00285E920B|nr:restriction endonuclease subunit S [Tardiphaga robiniae]MDR6657584.1 type I restriction enzyme S subunit [Tardiphaga robiniae]